MSRHNYNPARNRCEECESFSLALPRLFIGCLKSIRTAHYDLSLLHQGLLTQSSLSSFSLSFYQKVFGNLLCLQLRFVASFAHQKHFFFSFNFALSAVSLAVSSPMCLTVQLKSKMETLPYSQIKQDVLLRVIALVQHVLHDGRQIGGRKD